MSRSQNLGLTVRTGMENQGTGGRGNNDGDALLPTLPTVETQRTNGRSASKTRKRMTTFQMEAAVAAPEKVNDNEDKTEILKGITEKILDPRFRTNWDGLEHGERKFALKQVLSVCKKVSNPNNFEKEITGNFRIIFGDDDDDEALAEFVSTVYKDCVHEGLIIVQVNKFTERVVSINRMIPRIFGPVHA